VSATTPGIRRIWMEAIVQCVDQRMAHVSDASEPMDRASSVADAATVKSDSAGQSPASPTDDALTDHKTGAVSHSDAAANSCSQTVLDRAEPELTSVPQLLSSDTCAPPAVYSDTMLRTDSHSTDVCSISTQCVCNYCLAVNLNVLGSETRHKWSGAPSSCGR